MRRPSTALTLGLMVGVTLSALESLTVLAVMPQVARELNGFDLYGWVFAGFFLASAISIPVAARVVDAWGLGRPFAVGLGVFGFGLLLAGFAPSMPVLVVARVFQGLGSGALIAAMYASVAIVYPPHDRARVLALFSSAWLIPSFVGPLLGSLIATVAGWRWTFLALAFVVPLVAALVLPAVDGHRPRTVTTLRQSMRGGLLPPPSIRRAAALGLLGNLSMYGLIAFAPLAVTDLRGGTTFDAGLAVGVLSVFWVISAWIHQRLAGRIALRDSVRWGFLIVALSLAFEAGIVLPELPYPAILAGWVVCGLGAGIAFQALNLYVFAEAETGAEGRATSSVQLAITIGAAIGTSVMGTLLTAGRGAGLSLQTALAVVFGLCVALAGVGVAIAWGLPSVRDRRADTAVA